ncbi:formate dehydrogenase subunit gamma [Pseudonocardia sulfidoxydans NBRC 16205]|uniref:Formate dehydrogenase subunit gamma n=1 Tax=Pseudonocardia sulfidoxydans NBRC 16205 TaxID=1223511 RepID=A0A511DQU6_9PSEU|nr:formate dehydrogenase subunit gamma [Pseudonocardia sulfidoxydans]GEL25418.1 formate dehydrogenase subunit gamma [Pseudonocardia sulfidoxydans NBRC 16205]
MSIEAPPARVDEVVSQALEAHSGSRGALLPILHAVQAELGHVPPSVVPVLADRLNLSTAEVHGVVTFYRDFRTTPPGRVTVRVCRAEACQAVGGQALLEHAVTSLGVARGETTPDGAVTLDEVFCLGNCALGPAVQVGDRLHGRVTPARLDALIGQTRGLGR